jgi:endonuclease/exonuclease/phosphatase family metal-dependent hydrolase
MDHTGERIAKGPLMLILSWNVRFQTLPSNLDNIIDRINLARPDIVTLQEIDNNSSPVIEERLQEIGLTHIYDSRFGIPRERKLQKKYHCVIASRWKVENRRNWWRREAPFLELLGRTTVHTPDGEIDIFTAHIPNGSNNGWRKIDTFNVLSKALRKADDAPRILTGDFNEPRQYRRSGQIVTWSEILHKKGGTSIPKLKNKLGKKRAGTEWTYGVLAVLSGASHHGLHDAYRLLHGFENTPVTHITAQKTPRCYDHTFVSRHFEVISCGYFHEWRECGLSDHSAMWTKLRLRSEQPPLSD